MEEELKELAKAYMDVANGLTAKWPKDTKEIETRKYPEAVKDFSAAATLEMVSNDIMKLLLSHMDDGR